MERLAANPGERRVERVRRHHRPKARAQHLGPRPVVRDQRSKLFREGRERAGAGVVAPRQGRRQRLAVARQRQREPVAEIVRRDRTVFVAQRDLVPVQRVAVRGAEDRQQDLPRELRLEGLPLDVEVLRVRRMRAPRQHVLPPGVLGACIGVVGDEVEDHAEARVPRGVEQPPERVRTAELLADAVVVHDIVAVRAAGPRLGDRGEIEMTDAEPPEILELRAHAVKPQVRAELQPIRGDHGQRHARRTGDIPPG